MRVKRYCLLSARFLRPGGVRGSSHCHPASPRPSCTPSLYQGRWEAPLTSPRVALGSSGMLGQQLRMRFAEFLSESCSQGPFRGTQTSPRRLGGRGRGARPLLAPWSPLHFLPQTFLPLHALQLRSPCPPPPPPTGVNVLNPHQGPGPAVYFCERVGRDHTGGRGGG